MINVPQLPQSWPYSTSANIEKLYNDIIGNIGKLVIDKLILWMNTPQQKNGNDCGVFVIAITRLLIDRYEKGLKNDELWEINNENEFIFSTLEERAKIYGKEISLEKNDDYDSSSEQNSKKSDESSEERKSIRKWRRKA